MLTPKTHTPPSMQHAQLDLLLEMSSVVPFSARIHQGRLQLRWTPRLCRLLGIPAGQHGWRGGPLFNSYVAAQDVSRVQAACQRLIDVGEPMNVGFSINDGMLPRFMQVSAQVLQADQLQVVGVLRDCTADLRRATQLQSSQQRLHSLGRLTLLGEVAAGLAHELNQPLAAIATFGQAGERLLGLPEPRLEKAQEVFREISQQALRAGDIIRHMRSLINRCPIQLEPVSCASLMRDFLVLAEPMARASQVQLITTATLDHIVKVDVAQIHQAMMFLLQNALDASALQLTPAPVQIELIEQPHGIKWVISDQGPGISTAVAAQLFQPFFSTKENGTGLGLISCRNILEAHGARLSYENLDQGGCRFWFELPYDYSA